MTRAAYVTGRIGAHSLVRYRGMVQSTLDAEYCPAAVTEVDGAGGSRTVATKYRDVYMSGPGVTPLPVPPVHLTSR